MHLFCFGYGYVAQFLSRKLPDWKVSGTSRKSNINDVNIFNYNKIDKDILKDVTHVLISIPTDGDNILEKYGHHLQNIKWLGYLSATSVYGNHSGNWVNESSQTKPTGSTGKSRLMFEKKWIDSKLPVHIFRLAGIYGPGRNVLINLKLGNAKSVKSKEGHVFSRIHVEDIVNILLASMNNINPGEIYNCADDLPAPQADVIAYAAKLLNIDPPKLVDISCLSSFAQNFYLESKRVSNTKIKQDLNVSLVYPNYRIGLNALLNDMETTKLS